MRRVCFSSLSMLLAMLALAAGKAMAADAKSQLRWCESLARSVPGLTPARCMAAALVSAKQRSVQGRPLSLRDVPPRSGNAKVKILVMGGMHGDELTSSSIVFDWIERAVRINHESIHWRMLPAVNPDGLVKRPATRVNARGVDLNRNFPTDDWAKEAKSYWIKNTKRDPRRFPGPKALSEPETRWVLAQIDDFKPDLIVSVHAPYGVLDFDGPPPPPLRVGELHLHQVGIYPGSLGNYGGVKRGVPVVTLELKHAAEIPSEDELELMWDDLTAWVDQRLLRVAAAESEPAPAR